MKFHAVTLFTLWATFQALAQTDRASAGVSDFSYHLSTNLVGHARGFSGSPQDMVAVSGWKFTTYTNENIALLKKTVWSRKFWLKGVQGLNATCIGYSNGLGGRFLVSMVSPRHYLRASHALGPVGMIAFLDTNNRIYWRTNLQEAQVGNDTSVGILNEDLPPSVDYLPVLPAGFTNYLPANATSYVQGIGMNQDLKLFSQPMKSFGMFIGWSSAATSPFGLGTNWNIALRGGDSSNPAMLLVGNQLVLVSHNWSPGGGPNYGFQFDAINQQMHHLSTNNHLQTDYQLTPFSLTDWRSIR